MACLASLWGNKPMQQAWPEALWRVKSMDGQWDCSFQDPRHWLLVPVKEGTMYLAGLL